MISAGERFREAVEVNQLLQIVGTINAYSALLAERAGACAIYLSGAGVANASLGLPDIGISNLNDVLTDARRITNASSLPLLVDIDTGWGTSGNIARSIRECISAGVAAVHIEDQIHAKRCGHLPGKQIVPQSEMLDRIKAAVDAKTCPHFVIMARTDAFATEGLSGLIDRASAYLEAGADMIFPEAITTLSDYQNITQTIQAPVLANITEFGKTPLFSYDELVQTGVKMALYPLSAFRAMSQASLNVYSSILHKGSQNSVVDTMQTREALYDVLGYNPMEEK